MSTVRIESYQKFGGLWQTILKDYTTILPKNNFPCVAKKINDHYFLDAIIHLRDWPEQAKTGRTRRSNKVDLLVHAQEHFTSTKPYSIIKSNVSVSYFDTNLNTDPPEANSRSTIRFDYEPGLLASHPIFHLHCDSVAVTPPNTSDIPSWRYRIEANENFTVYPFRVPTPHMGLCNVLLGLVADHLEQDTFRKFWKILANKGWVPPLPAETNLWERCNPSANVGVPFHNWQWYFWPEEKD